MKAITRNSLACLLTTAVSVGAADANPPSAITSGTSLPSYTRGPCHTLEPVAKPTPDTLSSFKLGPLTGSVGAQEQGGFGASIKGTDDPYTFVLTCDSARGAFGLDYGASFAIGYTLDGSLSTLSSAHNSLSVGVVPKIILFGVMPGSAPARPVRVIPVQDADSGAEATPTLDLGDTGHFAAPRRVFALDPYVDGRYRTGDFQDVNGHYSRANQLVYGGGLLATWDGARTAFQGTLLNGLFRAPPGLSTGYYGVSSIGGTTGPLPADLAENYASVSITTKISMPLLGKSLISSPLALTAEFDESIKNGTDKPKPYTNLALVYSNSSGIKPAITYRSGQQGGFSFDRQVLFGILWDLI